MTKLWNTNLYDQQHSFVWQLAEDLIELLAPQAGEQILDLGCGTGHLTARIADRGAQVWGLDYSPEMIQKARKNYPHLVFAVGNAKDFTVNEPVDAIFSNAVLHWIKDADSVITCIYQALKPGGRFVAEFGGKGNVKSIMKSVFKVLETRGYSQENPNYFPSISDYTGRLERQGLEVTQAVLFDRPTLLEGGETGLENWLKMFAIDLLSPLSQEEKTQAIQEIKEMLRPLLYHDGIWTADYRRLRIIAYKR